MVKRSLTESGTHSSRHHGEVLLRRHFEERFKPEDLFFWCGDVQLVEARLVVSGAIWRPLPGSKQGASLSVLEAGGCRSMLGKRLWKLQI